MLLVEFVEGSQGPMLMFSMEKVDGVVRLDQGCDDLDESLVL